jgi:plastocyanin
LRLGGTLEETAYEVVEIIDTPAWTALTAQADSETDELQLQEAFVFESGDTILVGAEQMEVASAPAAAVLAVDITAEGTELQLEDAGGFQAGQTIFVRREKMTVESVSGSTLTVERAVDDTAAAEHVAGTTVREEGDRITVERAVNDTEATGHRFGAFVTETGNEVEVERGAFGTDAAEHEVDTEVFNGPSPPSDAITGEDTDFPPCGQLPPRAASAGAEVTVEGSADILMGDNFFDAGGNQNPTFVVPQGSTVTFNLSNDGAAPHNMRVSGADGEYESGDDAVSDPDLVTAGGTATLAFTAPAPGDYDYRCDFHADQMQGQITVQ